MHHTEHPETQVLSVLELFRIGIGPSSSHTLGPWRAAQRFLQSLAASGETLQVLRIQVLLYGSLAKAGQEKGTELAVILGLAGYDPVTVDPGRLLSLMGRIQQEKQIRLGGIYPLDFDPAADLVFLPGESLPFHPRALTFLATLADGSQVAETYYSTGGGTVCQEGERDTCPGRPDSLPYPVQSKQQVLAWCGSTGKPLATLLFANERAFRPPGMTRRELEKIRETMQESVYRGCLTEGELPGSPGQRRRAAVLSQRLLGTVIPDTRDAWYARIRSGDKSFGTILAWVSCFALAVHEENAAYGRIVTAPGHRSAGVLPAVLLYVLLFRKEEDTQGPIRFLLVAGMIGSMCKNGAISTAGARGCQAGIGVASAMAAAGLTDLLGGTAAQVFLAAEIALEQHAGLPGDQTGGTMQVSCIDGNAMGAVKAILAAQLARYQDPDQEQTADMHDRYTETAGPCG